MGRAPHGAALEAATRSDGYARRRPEATALYELIPEHWPDFRARAEESGSELPKFVVDEFEQ